MRLARTTILAGGAALLAVGTAAVAADKLHTMNVTLPDGSMAHIEYAGDVAPKVTVQAVEAAPVAFVDPFAELDRMAAYMVAQHRAMMQQVAAMQRAAMQAAAGAPGQVTLASDLPAGTHFTYVSTTIDANGCARTVRYSSDGSADEAPKVTRASAGTCDAAPQHAAPVTASESAPAAAPAGPGTRV
jgi:hypothetical protein